MANYLEFMGRNGTIIPCSNSTDAVNQKYDGCCNLTETWNLQHETVMRVLKYSIPMPHLLQTIEELQQDFHDLETFLPYPNDLHKGTEDDAYEHEFENRKTYNARVPICYKGQEDNVKLATECNMFVRSFTNEGIGFTFNAESFWELHKNTDSNALFYDIMKPYLRDENDTKIFYPASSGNSQEITVVIEKHSYLHGDVVQEEHKRKFENKAIKISLHAPGSPSNMRDESLQVSPGYVTKIIIYPASHESTVAVKSLGHDKRKCRFPHETEGLKIFDKYTQKACLFECQVSYGHEMCGCIPWDYPRFGLNVTISDYMGNGCFEHVLSKMKTASQCNCPFPCEEYYYTLSRSATPIDANEFCEENVITDVDLKASTRYLSFNR